VFDNLDPSLDHAWHPVALSRELRPGGWLQVRLLGRTWMLRRTADGLAADPPGFGVRERFGVVWLAPAEPIDVPQGEPGGDHDPRTVLLQTLGHFVLGHEDPRDHRDFLRQRVEANYFAAALMIPEDSAVAFLQRAKADRALAVEDLRDVYSVSYERRRTASPTWRRATLDCACTSCASTRAAPSKKSLQMSAVGAACWPGAEPRSAEAAVACRRRCLPRRRG
jgi:hypothetical protein